MIAVNQVRKESRRKRQAWLVPKITRFMSEIKVHMLKTPTMSQVFSKVIYLLKVKLR